MAAPGESRQISVIVKMLYRVHANQPRQTSVSVAGHIGCGFRRSFMQPARLRSSTASSIPIARGRRLSTPTTPVFWCNHSPSRDAPAWQAEDEVHFREWSTLHRNGRADSARPFTLVRGKSSPSFIAIGRVGIHTAASGADGAAKSSSNLLRLADQHRAGAPLSSILPLARILGGAGEAARLECLVSAGHHECGSGLQRPNRIFSRLPCALHHLLANLRHSVDVHLAHPVQHLLSRPLPYRHPPPVDQVAHHCSPDPDRPRPVRYRSTACFITTASSNPIFPPPIRLKSREMSSPRFLFASSSPRS